MINNFYLTKQDAITIDPDVNPVLASEPSLVAKIINGKTDIISVIEAIEKYNKDNKLAYKNRIKYSILLGEYFITVAQGYFSTDKSTFICLAYDQTGLAHYEYGKGEDAMKLKNVTATLTTHYIPVSLIVDVVVHSYDDKLFTLKSIKNNKVDDIPANELKEILTKTHSDFNSLCSAGMYKSAITKFNMIYNKYKLNKLDTFKYKGTVYNLYIQLSSLYIQLIERIVAGYDKWLELKQPLRTGNNMYYVNYASCNDTVMIYFSETLKKNNIRDGNTDIKMLKERTFAVDNIGIYKEILSGSKWENKLSVLPDPVVYDHVYYPPKKPDTNKVYNVGDVITLDKFDFNGQTFNNIEFECAHVFDNNNKIFITKQCLPEMTLRMDQILVTEDGSTAYWGGPSIGECPIYKTAEASIDAAVLKATGKNMIVYERKYDDKTAKEKLFLPLSIEITGTTDNCYDYNITENPNFKQWDIFKDPEKLKRYMVLNGETIETSWYAANTPYPGRNANTMYDGQLNFGNVYDECGVMIAFMINDNNENAQPEPFVPQEVFKVGDTFNIARLSIPGFPQTYNNVEVVCAEKTPEGKDLFMTKQIFPEAIGPMKGILEGVNVFGESESAIQISRAIDSYMYKTYKRHLISHQRNYDGVSASETIFLPLEFEIFGDDTNSKDKYIKREYKQWDVFKDPNNRIKTNNGKPIAWWAGNLDKTGENYVIVNEQGESTTQPAMIPDGQPYMAGLALCFETDKVMTQPPVVEDTTYKLGDSISLKKFELNNTTYENLDLYYAGNTVDGNHVFMSQSLIAQVSMDQLTTVNGNNTRWDNEYKSPGEGDIFKTAEPSIDAAVFEATGKHLKENIRIYDGGKHIEKIFLPLECEINGTVNRTEDKSTLDAYPQWKLFSEYPDNKQKAFITAPNDQTSNGYPTEWWLAGKTDYYYHGQVLSDGSIDGFYSNSTAGIPLCICI